MHSHRLETITYLVVIVVRKLCPKGVTNENTGFEGPSTCHISHRITTTAENHGGQVKALHKVHTVRVAPHTEVEASETVARKTVATTLQDHRFGSVPFHNALNNGLKDALVGDVINAIAEREVDGIVLALTHSDIAQLTRTWEVLAVLVEGHRHHTVSRVECLLNTISVVDININVEHALLESQQLQDTQNDVCVSSAKAQNRIPQTLPFT